MLCFTVQLKVGSITTVVHISFLLLAINTWGYTFFEMEEFPAWALNVDSVLRPAVTNATVVNGTTPLLSTTADGLVAVGL